MLKTDQMYQQFFNTLILYSQTRTIKLPSAVFKKAIINLVITVREQDQVGPPRIVIIQKSNKFTEIKIILRLRENKNK